MAVKTSWAAGDVLTAADLTDTFAAKFTTPGAWTSWTPTLSNLTIGNGTVTAKYQQIGKLVACRVTIVLGSTSSLSGGGAQFTVPVTATSMGSVPAIGVVTYLDAGTATYIGHIRQESTTSALFTVATTGSTYAGEAVITSTVPFTWGNTDAINGTFFYEAA